MTIAVQTSPAAPMQFVQEHPLDNASSQARPSLGNCVVEMLNVLPISAAQTAYANAVMTRTVPMGHVTPLSSVPTSAWSAPPTITAEGLSSVQ